MLINTHIIVNTHINTQIINNTNYQENHCLTLSRKRPFSYRNQSIDLQSKSMDWFLYDNGLFLERVNNTADYLLILPYSKDLWDISYISNKKLISGKMNSYRGLHKKCIRHYNHMSAVAISLSTLRMSHF